MQDDERGCRPIIPFTNHLVFRRVMRDPVTAKELLERILHIDIDRIEYCNTEQMIDFDLEAKGVRLDLYVRDSERVFNVEMQTQDYASLGKRMAYYQAAMRADSIERGAKNYELTELFVIFLCADDPFGHAKARYTFSMACEEVDDLALDTGSHWIVLNAANYAKEQDKGVRSLLQYVATQETTEDDPLVNRIDEKVRILNHDEEMVGMAIKLMTLEEDAIARGMFRGLREGREKGRVEGRAEGRVEGRAEGRVEGRAEGIAEGEARLSDLINRLISGGRADEIGRVTTDVAYRQQLFKEFGIA